MTSLTPDKILDRLTKLPTPQVLLNELMREFRSTNVSIDKLAHKIGKDPALSATVLRLANSSFYSMAGRIASLHQAALVLGMHTLEAIVVAASLSRQFSTLSSDHDWSRFWTHSFATAICARNLAAQQQMESETAFAAGLLHDLGRLILGALCAAEYRMVIEQAKHQHMSLLEAERTTLGFDHTIIGGALARRWKLPAVVQHAIEYHHQPDAKDVQAITDLTYIANLLMQDPEHPDVQPALDLEAAQPVWQRLIVNMSQLQLCVDEAAVGGREIASMLLEGTANHSSPTPHTPHAHIHHPS